MSRLLSHAARCLRLLCLCAPQMVWAQSVPAQTLKSESEPILCAPAPSDIAPSSLSASLYAIDIKSPNITKQRLAMASTMLIGQRPVITSVLGEVEYTSSVISIAPLGAASLSASPSEADPSAGSARQEKRLSDVVRTGTSLKIAPCDKSRFFVELEHSDILFIHSFHADGMSIQTPETVRCTRKAQIMLPLSGKTLLPIECSSQMKLLLELRRD